MPLGGARLGAVAPHTLVRQLCVEGSIQQLGGDGELQCLASTCDEGLSTLQGVTARIDKPCMLQVIRRRLGMSPALLMITENLPL